MTGGRGVVDRVDAWVWAGFGARSSQTCAAAPEGDAALGSEPVASKVVVRVKLSEPTGSVPQGGRCRPGPALGDDATGEVVVAADAGVGVHLAGDAAEVGGARACLVPDGMSDLRRAARFGDGAGEEATEAVVGEGDEVAAVVGLAEKAAG